MPKFDFFHINGYGRAPRKNGDPKAHITGIVAEVERRQHACRHVRSPIKPIRIFGCSPSEAAAEAIAQVDHAKDAIGRKVRIDGIVMFAAVASYPTPTTSVVTRKDGSLRIADPDYRAWQKAALAWAQKQFGSALKSAVLHVDEEFPHLHFFIVPPLVGDRLRHDLIHPGRAAIVKTKEKTDADARAAAKAMALVPEVSDKDRKRAERLAYCEAMMSLLDSYHDHIGVKFGHERYGPGRGRRSRAVHLAIRRAEQERDAAVEAEKNRLRKMHEQARRDDERRVLACEAAANGSWQLSIRYRDSLDAELTAERQRGDDAEAALAAALAILEAHGLGPSSEPRPRG